MQIKVMTVTYPIDATGVWLGKKNGGLGHGLYNGFGGHEEETDPDLEFSAKRETWEEAQIKADKIEKCGITLNLHVDKDLLVELHFFLCREFSGIPQCTEEMEPQHFPFDKIPYSSMWPHDQLILPLFLQRKKVIAWFLLNNNQVIEHLVKQVDDLPRVHRLLKVAKI